MALSLVDIESGLPEAWEVNVENGTVKMLSEGLPKASDPKLPLYKDKFSKEGLCGTPFSQASTAPSTPIRFFLPDPFDVPLPHQFDVPPPQPSFSFSISFTELPLSICASPWWAEYKEAEKKPDVVRAPRKPKFLVPKPALSICMSPWWAQYRQGWKDCIPPALGIAEPFLMSELAIWAQQVVTAKARQRGSEARSQQVVVYKNKYQIKQYQPRSQQEFAVLKSVYAHKYREYLPRNQQEFAVLQFVYTHEYRPSDYLPRNQQEFAVLAFVYTHKYRSSEYLPRKQQHFAVLEFVYTHEYRSSEYPPRKQDHFAVLEFVYTHEYRSSEYPPRNQQQFAVLEFVTKQEHEVENADVVDDDDWDIQGQTQDTKGEDVSDDDDEWLQVEDLYTPSAQEGMCVLTSNPDSVGVAGRAFTPDGRVIDLDGGGPVAFSCEAGRSSGHVDKVAAINKVKARLAKAASDVDTETVCSIDTDGTVRGGAALDAAAARTNRFKLFHRKRKHSQGAMTSSKATRHSQVLSVDVCGRLFAFNVKKCVKSHRKARVEVSNTPKTIMTIDATSVVHTIKEHWDVRRGMDIDPDVVLLIDAEGVIRNHDDPFAGL